MNAESLVVLGRRRDGNDWIRETRQGIGLGLIFLIEKDVPTFDAADDYMLKKTGYVYAG